MQLTRIGGSVLFALALGLAACGSDGTPAAGPTTTAVAVETTTIPVGVPSVSQIASVVAKSSPDIRRTAMNAKPCDLFGSPLCDVAAQLSYEAVASQARTLDLSLQTAGVNRSAGTAGVYPAELTKLVADTRAAAADFSRSHDAYTNAGCGGKTPGATCEALARQRGFGLSKLLSMLDAWSPYGVR